MSVAEASEQTATTVPAGGTPARSAAQVVALAVLAVATLIVALSPVAGRQVTYHWSPPDSFNLGKTQLMMPAAPQSLEASWPCTEVRAVAPAAGQFPLKFFSTGYSSEGEMSAWLDNTTVSLQLAGRPILNAQLPLPVGECLLQLRYNDADRTVTLSDGRLTRTVPLKTSVVRDTDAVDAMQVTGLRVPTSLAPYTDVTIVARPSTQEWTLLQWAFAAAGLLAALYLWWSFFRRSPPGNPGRPTPRWTGSDTAVAVAGVAGLFLIPPLADDGWVLTTVRAFPQLGFFSNFFTADAAAQPEGFWWTSIERIWMTPLGTSILALRIPAVVIGVLGWWYLRRRVLDQLDDNMSARWLRAVAAAVYIPLLLAWFPTLRPEPVVGLLAVIAVALVLRYRERQDAWVLIAAAIVSALAFSAHQTGWIVVGVCVAMIPDLRDGLRTARSRALSTVLMAAATFVFLTALLMLLKSNVAILAEARASFIEGGRHNAVLDEATRVRLLLNSAATSPVRLLSAMLVPVAALAWLALARSWPRSPARLAAGAAALGGVFLAFTSSKWMWHFGATAGVVTVAVALIIQQVLRSHRAVRVVVVLVPVIGWLATSRGPGWGLQDLRLLDPSRPVLPAAVRLAVWAAAMGLALWALARGRRPLAVTGVSVLAVSTVVTATSAGPILVDGIRESSTSWPRLVADSLYPGNCGLASSLRVPTVTKPLAEQSGQVPDPSISKTIWSDRQNLPMPPVPDVNTIEPATGFPIPLATPWYTLDQRYSARTWMHAAAPGVLSYTVEWRTESGATGSFSHNRFVGGPSWALVELDVPADADSVRLTWTNNPFIDVVLSPVAVVADAAFASVAYDPVLRTPASALYAPCFGQPDIAQGSLERFGWSLGLPFLGQSTVATGVADFSEQACIDNPSSEAWPPLCWYRVTVPSPVGLRTTTATVER